MSQTARYAAGPWIVRQFSNWLHTTSHYWQVRQTDAKYLLIMGVPIKFHRWYILALTLLTLALNSCAPQGSPKNLTATDVEQVYIDLKQGFSLVVPVVWKRQKVRVSSPDYRSDTIQWQLTASDKHPMNSFLVRTYPYSSQSNLNSLLSAFLKKQPALIHQKIENITLPAGTALRLQGRDRLQHVTYLAIDGQDRSYIVAFRISDQEYAKYRPMLKKIISSFTIF